MSCFQFLLVTRSHQIGWKPVPSAPWEPFRHPGAQRPNQKKHNRFRWGWVFCLSPKPCGLEKHTHKKKQHVLKKRNDTHTHKRNVLTFSFRKTASKNLGVLVDDGGTACSLSSLVSILELWSLTNLGSVQNQSVKLRRVYVFVGREWMESLPNKISRLHKYTWSI